MRTGCVAVEPRTAQWRRLPVMTKEALFWSTPNAGGCVVTVVQAYSRFMVIFFIAVGLGCLIKPLTDAPGGGLILWPEAGRTFGIFLINWVHTVLHLGLAVYAVLALSRTSAARGFARTVFWVCL